MMTMLMKLLESIIIMLNRKINSDTKYQHHQSNRIIKRIIIFIRTHNTVQKNCGNDILKGEREKGYTIILAKGSHASSSFNGSSNVKN